MGKAQRIEFHLAEANLGLAGKAHFAPHRHGKQLQAEAHAHVGAVALQGPFADGGNLGGEPGVSVGLPDVHGPAHHQQEIIRGERRNRLTPVQHHHIGFHAARGEEAAEQAGRFVIHMLEGKGATDHGQGPSDGE